MSLGLSGAVGHECFQTVSYLFPLRIKVLSNPVLCSLAFPFPLGLVCLELCHFLGLLQLPLLLQFLLLLPKTVFFFLLTELLQLFIPRDRLLWRNSAGLIAWH